MRVLALAALLAFAAPCAAAKSVVVYGDSIAAGNALPPSDQPKVWVRRVGELSGGRLQTINEAKGGRWTRALDEFDAMLRRQPPPDVLVIALGTNDSGDATPRMLPQVEANMRAMVERARRAWVDVSIVIVAPPQLRADRRPAEDIGARNERLRAIGRIFAQLARDTGGTFVDLYGVVPEESLAADGMHPDAAGNEVIARTLLRVLLKGAK